MKVVKLFVASSIEEFKEERIFLGDFIRRYNDKSIPKGYRVKLFLCEDESDNYQPIYDRQINNCDFFIAFIGASIGKYTQHELEVARDCQKIKRKIIVLKSSSEELLPDAIKSYFNVITLNNDFMKQLYELLVAETELMLPYIEETQVLPSEICKFSIPDICDNLESAIIGNIIRGFNEQHEGEFAIEACEGVMAHDCDTFVALLSNGFDSEIRRVQGLLDANIAMEILWAFHNRGCARDSIIDGIILALREKNKYEVEYESSDELALEFKCMLLTKIVNIIIGTKVYEQFEYVVEDHLLIRRSISGGKFIVKNLTSISNDPETRRRKETIIRNLLNYYHTFNLEKYKDALRALEISDFDYFVYQSPDEVRNLHVPIFEANQAAADYVIESLENLHKGLANLSESDLLEKIHEISAFLNDYRIGENDSFLIDFEIGVLLSSHANFYGTLFDKADEFFKKAYCISQGIPTLDVSEKEKVLKCVLHICEICYIKNEFKDLKRWASLGIGFLKKVLTADCDEEKYHVFLDSEFMLYVYRARSSVYKEEMAGGDYDKAKKLLETVYHSDNYYLSRYIQLRYEMLIYDIMRDNEIGESIREVLMLIDDYQKYLSYSDDYLLEKAYLNILVAFLKNDISIWEEALETINNNKLLNKNKSIYLDVYFIGSEMNKRTGQFKEAIAILNKLINEYKGVVDRAICLKSRGSCYEELLEDKGSLCQAERDFRDSLKLFKKAKQNRFSGYVMDDLAFCLILQKKYSKAEIYAKKAIAVTEYEVPNKYCNYITSLMCQDRFEEAQNYLFGFDDVMRSAIMEGLKKDWAPNDYMSRMGIETSNFYWLFSLG